MDRDGKVLVHKNIKGNDFDYFLKLVEPYRFDLTLCCECTFNWYWLADACEDAGIEFGADYIMDGGLAGIIFLSQLIRNQDGHAVLGKEEGK